MTQREEIEAVWNTEREILDVVHRVCTENNLRYSLAYGTLLGAVRHGGFIPWDDDVDLIMPREDYEVLLKIWDKVAPTGYILQNSRTDPDFTQNFTKIRKDHTTFLQYESERYKGYNKGIFVDIFPGDRVAPGGLKRKLQYVACAVNLLYTRGFPSGAKGIIGVVERILLRTPQGNYVKWRERAESLIRNWNGRIDCKYFFPNTIESAKRYYKPGLFQQQEEIMFCGKQYCCISESDAFLRTSYGNYMQLPPESERIWKHHPILIDFKHNYEELTE